MDGLLLYVVTPAIYFVVQLYRAT